MKPGEAIEIFEMKSVFGIASIINFANSISKNSKTQVIIVKTELELIKYFKRNLTSNEIIIGMGAGSISKWMIGLKSSLWI